MVDTVTGPDALGQFHRVLEQLWAEHPCVPSAIQISIATAVAEIGANIVVHAAPGRSVPLRMQAVVLPHEVIVVFTDGGDEAAVDLDEVRLPDDLSQRGRGLAVTAAMLGRLTYRREGSANRWTLVSRRFG